MVSIDYRKSKSGYDNCFELNFNEKELIPSVFYKNGERGAALHFFIELLRKADMLAEDEKGEDIIWCRHYKCNMGDIPFTMVYDIEYDTVSFSVEPENCKYREEIAEKLRYSVETAE